MADFEILKESIREVIKTNGNGEITGALLQQTLITTVDTLGGAINDNEESANRAQETADGARDAAGAAQESAEGAMDAAGQAQQTANSKADKEGVLPELMAGGALSLLGNAASLEFVKQQYAGASGLALVKEIRGKSMLWNQLVQNGDFAEATGWLGTFATIAISDNACEMTKTAAGAWYIRPSALPEIVAGHRYYYSAILTAGTSSAIGIGFINQASQNLGRVAVSSGTARVSNIYTATGEERYFVIRGANGDAIGAKSIAQRVFLCDLTAMFGAGKEPATVAEFEALFPLDYYTANTGEILNNTAESVQVLSDGAVQSTLSLNIPTLTGKLNGEGEGVTIFPDGMRSAGSVYDSLIVDGDGYARRAIVRTATRAYEAGDEDDAAVITDKTNTVYALATPEEYTLDEPIYLGFRAISGGTLKLLPENGARPTTTPIPMDAALPARVVSMATIIKMLDAMKAAEIFTDYTITYNPVTGEPEFAFTK